MLKYFLFFLEIRAWHSIQTFKKTNFHLLNLNISRCFFFSSNQSLKFYLNCLSRRKLQSTCHPLPTMSLWLMWLHRLGVIIIIYNMVNILLSSYTIRDDHEAFIDCSAASMSKSSSISSIPLSWALEELASWENWEPGVDWEDTTVRCDLGVLGVPVTWPGRKYTLVFNSTATGDNNRLLQTAYI